MSVLASSVGHPIGVILPGMDEAQVVPTAPCPQCFTVIPWAATKCPTCTADLRWCDRCQNRVGVIISNKWVGIARGGSKPVARCMRCRSIIEGPRW